MPDMSRLIRTRRAPDPTENVGSQHDVKGKKVKRRRVSDKSDGNTIDEDIE